MFSVGRKLTSNFVNPNFFHRVNENEKRIVFFHRERHKLVWPSCWNIFTREVETIFKWHLRERKEGKKNLEIFLIYSSSEKDWTEVKTNGILFFLSRQKIGHPSFGMMAYIGKAVLRRCHDDG